MHWPCLQVLAFAAAAAAPQASSSVQTHSLGLIGPDVQRADAAPLPLPLASSPSEANISAAALQPEALLGQLTQTVEQNAQTIAELTRDVRRLTGIEAADAKSSVTALVNITAKQLKAASPKRQEVAQSLVRRVGRRRTADEEAEKREQPVPETATAKQTALVTDVTDTVLPVKSEGDGIAHRMSKMHLLQLVVALTVLGSWAAWYHAKLVWEVDNCCRPLRASRLSLDSSPADLGAPRSSHNKARRTSAASGLGRASAVRTSGSDASADPAG